MFLAAIHMLDIAYFSKSLNHSETPFKMINYGPRIQRLRNTSGTLYKCQEPYKIADIVCYMDKFHVASNGLNSSILMREKNCSLFGYHWFTLRWKITLQIAFNGHFK